MTRAMIVDASNMAYRARYSYDLSIHGKDTSVTYGVLRMLMTLIKDHGPESLIMCFDGGRPQYRSQLVPQYKTNRKHDDDPTFAEYCRQVDELQRYLPYFGILCVRREGIEADDLMYHASRMLRGSAIVTNDEDLFQAIDNNTVILKPGKKEYKEINLQNFRDYACTDPENFLYGKALLGDSSDNIKGCKGLGPVAVTKLFSGLNLNENQKKAFEQYRDSGEWMRVIGCIDLKYDLSGARTTLINSTWMPFHHKMVYKYCLDNAFTSLIEAGSLGQLFGRLRAPVWVKDGLRFPRIWDAPRHPMIM